VTMATQSTLELYTPTVIAANQVRTIQEWRDVDHQLHLRLASNAPACRASLDQGRSLLRVGTKWRDEVTSLVEPDLLGEMSQLFDHDGYHFNASNSTSCHLASVFGVVAALHGLNAAQACQLLGYCVARDLVSAAVRMNLLGPIAGVAVLGRAHRAALLGIREGSSTVPTGASSSCAPLLDLIQPCHDLLATRLFRT
jgi:urease accessory protein